jgi:peptidoglycan/xylan/chitin deacetylase (PgdA/CDA1 family)
MVRVAVTHDVDRSKKSYHYLTKTIKGLIKGNFSAVHYQLSSLFSKNNPYWTFDDLLEILNEHQIKSTFFFLNETMKFNPLKVSNWSLSLGRYDIREKMIIDQILALKKQGHEIGVHGSFNSYTDLDLLLKEKAILEEILGEEIIGIRQHHLNLAKNTWELQKKAGFKYDSSWGLNFEIGVEQDKVVPFKPFKDEFLVIPMTMMDSPFVGSAAKWKQLEDLIQMADENDGVLVLNWHTDSLNEKEFPGHRSTFVDILKILKSKNASFYTMTEIYNQYSK